MLSIVKDLVDKIIGSSLSGPETKEAYDQVYKALIAYFEENFPPRPPHQIDAIIHQFISVGVDQYPNDMPKAYLVKYIEGTIDRVISEEVEREGSD